MRKPKAVRASAAETTAQRLGSEQAGMANAMKNRLIGAVNKAATRDDSAILRNSASAATARSTAEAVSGASTPVQRAAAIIGGNSARGRALSDANVTAKGSTVDRISDAVRLNLGAQEGSANSLTRLAQAQNNAAFTVADAKMRNTAATLGAIGNVVSTYGQVKANTAMTNELAKQNTLLANKDATEFQGVTMWGKPKTYKIGGG